MISKTYITQIFVDGIPIQSFSSKMHEYIIRIPQIKKSLKIDVSTSNHTNHAIIKDHHDKEFPIGSIRRIILYIYKITFAHSQFIINSNYISPKSRSTPNDETKSPLIDFHHYISTTGERPISLIVENLPTCLFFDEKSGTICGKTPSELGRHDIKITAINKHGADSIILKLINCHKPRLTPVQGWSSWYTKSLAISEDCVMKMADAAIQTGIKDYGFLYLNIDDCLQGYRNDENPPKLTGKKPFTNNEIKYGGFSNMSDLTSKIHSKGLKIGFYSCPKPSTYAGFLGSSSFNANGMDTDFFSPYNNNDNVKGPVFDEEGNEHGPEFKPGVWKPTQFYGSWFPGYKSSPGGKEVGKFWFGDIDAQQFAD